MAALVEGKSSAEEEEEKEQESVEHSTANGMTKLPSDFSRKLRILCLHGFRTSGTILSQQVALANWGPIFEDIAELVFVDGPWPANGKSDVEHRFAGPYFEWYQSNADRTEVSGLDEATAYFSNYLSMHEPFDGLLGFSQGGALAAAWLGLSEKGLEPNIPNVDKMFLIAVGAGKSKAKPFLPAYTDGIKCPSLHFIGDKDFLKEKGENLVSVCKDPILIRHPFGHIVPRLNDSERQIFRDFLLKQLRSRSVSLDSKFSDEDGSISGNPQTR